MRKANAGWARRLARRWAKEFQRKPPRFNNRVPRAFTMADAERQPR